MVEYKEIEMFKRLKEKRLEKKLEKSFPGSRFMVLLGKDKIDLAWIAGPDEQQVASRLNEIDPPGYEFKQLKDPL